MLDPILAIDNFIHELSLSVMIEESVGYLMSDAGMSLASMDIIKLQKIWGEVLHQKSRLRALDCLVARLANIKHERIVMRVLWGIDYAVEKGLFSPREIAHALVCSEHLRVESPILFRCTFKLLLKLIFFLDYKSNREVFNKSIEKSSQFTEQMFCDRDLFNTIDPSLELIQLLLCREMCLMPAYFAMHELIRNFSSEFSDSPQYVQAEFNEFMDSFKRPARLLYSRVYNAMTPFCGITSLSAPSYKLDSSNLVLTSIKGAMRYPDFLTSSQLPLLCTVLGQLRSFELVTGMLDPASGKVKTRSMGLELALVELIVQVMELLESTNDEKWNRTMFEHLISVMITFMLNSTVRFNEIVVKLNTKLEGRTWTKSSHYVMWFVLNATSGFIGKNMLTDFVPCLRLFDILFPEAEDPDRAIDLPLPYCSRKDSLNHPKDVENISLQKDEFAFINPPPKDVKEDCSETCTSQFSVPEKMEMDSSEDANHELVASKGNGGENEEQTSTSAEDSNDECNQNETETLFPPHFRCSTACYKRQSRLLHLVTAPVCLWQHVLRKSRLGQDHLPRVMPPALRPFEAHISRRMQALVQSVSSTPMSSTSINLVSKLTWNQLFVVLNAFSTDNEVSQLIQRLVDIFWTNESENETQKPEHGCLWSRLIKNGRVDLPYNLSAYGRLRPLSHHLMRTMSVHLRMLVLHFFLQKFAVLPSSTMLTTPAVIETFCRILACREVESNSVNRILCLLTKLQPLWSYNSTNMDSKSSFTSSVTNEKDSNYFVCSLVYTLIDTIGFRLADILTPEVRIHAITSLVSLSKMWTSWNASFLDNKESKNIRDGTNGEIPLELPYLLDWSILKFARSIQAPDCVIYGFCSALTSPTLSQTQPGCNSLHSVSNSVCISQQQPLNVTLQPGTALLTNTGGSGGASVSIPLGRTLLPLNSSMNSISSASIVQPSNDTMISSNSGVNSLASSSGNSAFPNAIPGYPFLMYDNVEVDRFILFSLLQMYHTFDLEEVSGIRPNLVEQVRSMCEQCGASSLVDLPQIITSRLPDFLILVIRQLTNPTGGEFSSSTHPLSDSANTESMESSLPYTDKSTSLSKLCSMLQEEYMYFCNNNMDWTNAINRGNIFLCLLFRYFMEHQSVPGKAASLINRLSTKYLSRQLRMLCDYVVACMTFTAQVNFASEKLMHTRYQYSQLDAVNRIVIYLFTQSEQLITGINYLSTKFEPSPSNESMVQRKSPHSDPLSSRDWFSCVLTLHEIIPDQWITHPKLCTVLSGDNDYRDSVEDMDRPPHLPVFYGHLLLRLLPLLEVILIQFLTCQVPLVLLIPFCRVIAPLFRYHRRPVNVCFTLLHDHIEFNRKNLISKLPSQMYTSLHQTQSNGDYTGSSVAKYPRESDGDKIPWIIDRLSCQLVVHCVLRKHQQLAVKSASIRASKRFSQKCTPTHGLFSCQGWHQLDSCVKQSEIFYDLICNNIDTAGDDGDNKTIDIEKLNINIILNSKSYEVQLRNTYANWYNFNMPQLNNSDYLFELIDPICKSNQKHGISGHPAAWRTWNYEESVCVQTAGLYAASVEIMCNFTVPDELTTAVSNLLTSCVNHPDFNHLLNIFGALAIILPNVYCLHLMKFCVTLFNDPVLCDATSESNLTDVDNLFSGGPGQKSYGYGYENTKWRRSSRVLRHRKLLDNNFTTVEDSTLPACDISSSKIETVSLQSPPKVAVDFFEMCLPLDQNTNPSCVTGTNNADRDCIEASHGITGKSPTFTENVDYTNSSSDVKDYLVKANLWHSIWAHANTTHLALLPGVFSDLILPELHNEAQLLMAFYMVAPLMGSLHAERPAKLVDLTAELYRAVWKVDNILAKTTNPKSEDSEAPSDVGDIKELDEHIPSETGIPLVHVDTIADLLYHIKYMYVGNGVLDQVRPLLPQLRPSLRKRLKFILPQDSSVTQQQHDSYPVFEGRVYRASSRPPKYTEDF
uniref:Mediator of RNA polymerase II transcription subunit 23 n=1 Tax=Trichobilharzia regenti TaxID=157069 RepID=A0AA85IZN8_TRIRE|nr:unnamed protein product [Trichobilharzia regenti]